MSIKPESRDKLKDGVDKRKRGLDDREKHMGRVVKEKKAIDDASHKLRFPTKEGAAEIKKALEKASVTTQNEFKKQSEDLKKKHGECKKAEDDFRGRTELANQNALEARKAEGQIKEAQNAKNLVGRAEKASEDDARITDDLRSKQKKQREISERHRTDLKTQLMSTKLNFRLDF